MCCSKTRLEKELFEKTRIVSGRTNKYVIHKNKSKNKRTNENGCNGQYTKNSMDGLRGEIA